MVIVLGLLMLLFAAGGSIRRAYAGFSTLVQVTGRLDSVLLAFSPQPLSAIQAADEPARTLPPTRALTQAGTPPPGDGPPPVDMEAWEDFDPSVFDEDLEGFLPVRVIQSDDHAPPLLPLDEAAGAGAAQAGAVDDGAGTGSAAENNPSADAGSFQVFLPQVVNLGTVEEPEVIEPEIVVVEYGADLPGSETPEPPVIRAPDRIVIPRIGLDAPVVTVHSSAVRYAGQVYDQWQAPAQYAAGWHQDSARLGEAGNTVLNGHHNIYGMVYARLLELEQKDELIVYGEGETYHYIINQVMILEERGASVDQRAENARWIMPSYDERLTLVTCWPPESNTHRLIVVATRIK